MQESACNADPGPKQSDGRARKAPYMDCTPSRFRGGKETGGAGQNRTADKGSDLLSTPSSTSIHADSAMFQHLRAGSGANLATNHATDSGRVVLSPGVRFFLGRRASRGSKGISEPERMRGDDGLQKIGALGRRESKRGVAYLAGEVSGRKVVVFKDCLGFGTEDQNMNRAAAHRPKPDPVPTTALLFHGKISISRPSRRQNLKVDRIAAVTVGLRWRQLWFFARDVLGPQWYEFAIEAKSS